MNQATTAALVEFCQRLGDDRLILGHRLSEWCGHGPILEEDIALANFALDLIGQASNFLKLAGELEGKGRTEDTLAYLRDILDFKNLQLLEQSNAGVGLVRDFGRTMARQFLFDAWSVPLMERLQQSSHPGLAGIAAKAFKEEQYHLRHSREWILRLGDGTPESHERVQTAINDFWRYTAEMFEIDDTIKLLQSEKIIPNLSDVKSVWESTVNATLKEATLVKPEPSKFSATGSRQGKHGEALGHLLAEMQSLPRAHPGATW